VKSSIDPAIGAKTLLAVVLPVVAKNKGSLEVGVLDDGEIDTMLS